MPLFDEYAFYVEHTQKLSERRQSATQTFLTINTAIFTILAFLFKDVAIDLQQLLLICLPLLAAGILVCWLWRLILNQYKGLIGWRYKQLCEMEKKLPDSYRMLTKEWNEYYKPREDMPGLSFSDLEQQLPLIFGGLYIAGILLVIVVMTGWV